MNSVSTDIVQDELSRIWKLLEEINDPEVPVLSIVDLGIVREVQVEPDLQWLPRHGYDPDEYQNSFAGAWI